MAIATTMPEFEEYHLRPLGWQHDPDEERRKLSILDYISPMSYLNYALFFELPDADRRNVVKILISGLEAALRQARHLVGTIEKREDGDHAFVKRKNSTVKFVVQYMDSSDTAFPSLSDIRKNHFKASTLGDISILSNLPMTFGEKPEAHPDNSPEISSFKASFISGGLIFNMHSHHYANDITGWATFTKLLAGCCDAIVNKIEPPLMPPMCINHSRFTIPLDPREFRVTAPPQKQRHPAHKQTDAVLFHLPKSKAAALKQAASPEDGTWISTYDALCSIIWRVLSRIRQPLFKPDLGSKPIWGEAVNMRRRLPPPYVHPGTQGNLCYPTLSITAGIPQPTMGEVISGWPLWRLARYVRAMTEGVTEKSLLATLAAVAPVENKYDMSTRLDTFPPMSMVVTDWREADVCSSSFGFGKPVAYRHLFDRIVDGVVIVYPTRAGPGGEDEGIEIQFPFERELLRELVDDEEWGRYFEFRGVDM